MTPLRLLANHAVLCWLAVAITACGGGAERERWVTAASATYPKPPELGNGFGAYYGLESAVQRELRSRGIVPLESLCGVVIDYDPILIISISIPERVYHFRVTRLEAEALVSTGAFIYREQYDAALPFRQSDCYQFGLQIPS